MNRAAITRVEGSISAVLNGLPLIPGERLLIALSGGADSVAMTHGLHRLRDRLGVTVTAAHLNHRLRGDESDRDEHFVRALCERLQIELVVETAQDLAGSSNLEERAREVRYAFLNRVAERLGARHIAVAHHADDQAETVVLRLLRGSGVAGLAAMGPVGPGRIVRPLLELRREEILAYLDALGAGYVDDSSNLSPTMLRNRVRHQLIPTLERDYAPRLSRRLSALAREMRTLDDYITGEGRRELHRRLLTPDRLNLAGFAQLHPALSRSIIREWMRERLGDLRRIYRADIERVGRFCTIAAPGSTLRLARGWRLRCEYGSVVFEPIPASSAAPFAVELRRDGRIEIAAAGFSFEARLLDSRSPDSRSILGKAGLPQMEALIDADQIDGELIVRSFRRGDHIQLFGMTGTRKVHDVMVDRKLPRDRRASWPIVEAERGILWIPGMVRSRLALVSEATERLLHLIAKPRANPENTSLLRN